LITDDLDLDRPPYWPVLWPASLALARTLPGLLPTHLLELGCGTGLVGIVGALLWARVVQTDYIPAALLLARHNAERNGVDGIRRVAADWRAWPLRARFPLILASDVTYDRALHAALREVLECSLAPGGIACIADPGRPPTLAFFAALERDGWPVTL